MADQNAREAAPRRTVRGKLKPSFRMQAAFRAEEMALLGVATRTRLYALVVAGILLFILEPVEARYWYEGAIVLLALSGIAHHVMATRFGRASVGYVFVAVDAVLLVLTIVVLTARLQPAWPPQMALRAAPVAYLFMLTAYVAASYSPRLMLWAGLCVAAAWAAGTWWVAAQPGTVFSSTQRLDPRFVDVSTRLEEVVVLLMSTAVLAAVVRRSRTIVIRQARAARERANLARYFSPRVVDELAGRDEPLGPVRRQEVGVVFADIVGFTTLAETMPPEEVMALLRGFHSRMEREVFAYRGTLEKFIGDAMLATFGVPSSGKNDASDTVRCAFAMLASLEVWNAEREQRGEPRLRMGIGAHFGPAVLGDIGSERSMAFCVVGDTVNTASRLQSLTRQLHSDLVTSEALVDAVRREESGAERLLARLCHGGMHPLRGRGETVPVWLLHPQAPVEAPPAAVLV